MDYTVRTSIHRIFLSDSEIPIWEDAKHVCVNLHKSFPQFGVIGWDLVIDIYNNVKIMEWNTSQNAISLAEATTGPMFKGLGWENLWKLRR